MVIHAWVLFFLRTHWGTDIWTAALAYCILCCVDGTLTRLLIIETCREVMRHRDGGGNEGENNLWTLIILGSSALYGGLTDIPKKGCQNVLWRGNDYFYLLLELRSFCGFRLVSLIIRQGRSICWYKKRRYGFGVGSYVNARDFVEISPLASLSIHPIIQSFSFDVVFQFVIVSNF